MFVVQLPETAKKLSLESDFRKKRQFRLNIRNKVEVFAPNLKSEVKSFKFNAHYVQV